MSVRGDYFFRICHVKVVVLEAKPTIDSYRIQFFLDTVDFALAKEN